MYLFSGILLLICVIFFIINRHRKKKILKKLRCMEFCEKIRLLDELAEPFGFSYLCQDDILTSTKDAWQRQFGYCSLFDKSAPRLHMIFDCEPVYFSYDDQTWLIEFWKGQYGINTGAEIGIYQADIPVAPENYSKTLFHSISDKELLPLSMELFHHGKRLFSVQEEHWWLTGFCMGRYSRPKDLVLNCSLTFPNHCMMQSFVSGMLRAGYKSCELAICNLTVSFCFSSPKTKRSKCCRLRIWWSSLQNRLCCRLYRIITRPCCCTLDRILYLYYYLPAAFRRMLRLKRGFRI